MSVEDYTKPILAGEGASDYERYLRTDELLLRRAHLCLDYVVGQLEMLEQMSPWEYQAVRLKQRFYPELLHARNSLTELANEEE